MLLPQQESAEGEMINNTFFFKPKLLKLFLTFWVVLLTTYKHKSYHAAKMENTTFKNLFHSDFFTVLKKISITICFPQCHAQWQNRKKNENFSGKPDINHKDTNPLQNHRIFFRLHFLFDET